MTSVNAINVASSSIWPNRVAAVNTCSETASAKKSIDEQNQALRSGEPLETGTNSYTFEGRVEGAGIDVRRDPGDTFIWIAVVMALVGLSITFYVPRRRLWVKVTGERTQIAGIAEKTTRLGRELRLMGAELGAEDALQPGDLVRDG